MNRALRLSPVLLDGALAYLVSGDAEELGFLIDALPSALDHDLHRSVRGESTSCHVWPAFASTTAGEVHEHLEVAIARSRCCAAFVQEPLVSAVRCGCGQHCAATDSCWGCLDAAPTETVDGHPYCTDCARAVREAVGNADTLPPAAPDDDRAEAALGAFGS